jgi:hypothetical protein
MLIGKLHEYVFFSLQTLPTICSDQMKSEFFMEAVMQRQDFFNFYQYLILRNFSYFPFSSLVWLVYGV